MGRRALRKIDPTLDLARHLKTLDQMPRPWQPEVIFGRRAPLEVEIGSGKGLFLRTAAAAHPDVDFLGIEVSRRYARFSAAALAKRGLTNAAVVIADALRFLHDVLPDGSVAALHVYFPDPWWKRRHKKRRILGEPLVCNAARVLQSGGALHFWTDVEEYYHTGIALLHEAPELNGPLEIPDVSAQADSEYRTHFERRMRLHGDRVYRSLFRKR